MKIAAAIEKMTDFYKGNIHDIYHFLKVWAFAKNIGFQQDLVIHSLYICIGMMMRNQPCDAFDIQFSCRYIFEKFCNERRTFLFLMLSAGISVFFPTQRERIC